VGLSTVFWRAPQPRLSSRADPSSYLPATVKGDFVVTRTSALTDIVLAIAILLGAALVASVVATIVERVAALPLLAYVAIQAFAVLAGVAWIVRRRGGTWRELGAVSPVPIDVVRALIALFAVLVAAWLLAVLLMRLIPGIMEAHAERVGAFAYELVGDLPLPVIVLGMFVVAGYEELLARGLLLQRSRHVFGGVWLPVLASSILFGLGHIYQGWPGVLQTAVIGVVLARLTLHWGTLWPAILAHAALNTLTLVAARMTDGS
jgi:uncharacterized protein